MIEQIAAAFERQDYPEVTRLLQTLPPEDPWNRLYQGRLSEVLGEPAAAEAIYRQLLQAVTGSKITTQARQGLAPGESSASTTTAGNCPSDA